MKTEPVHTPLFEEIETTAMILSDIATEIGGIAETNSHYTFRLARTLIQSGKPLKELTIGELLEAHHDEKKLYNTIFGK